VDHDAAHVAKLVSVDWTSIGPDDAGNSTHQKTRLRDIRTFGV